MMIAPLLSATAARLKPRLGTDAAVAPLGLACALLLYTMLLVADSNIDRTTSSSQSWLQSRIEDALGAVQASMVELPPKAEASAVAQLANKIQTVLMESRQLTTELRHVEARYAELTRAHQAEFAALERGVSRTQDEVRWLQSQQEALGTQLATAMAARDPIETLALPFFFDPQTLESEGRYISVRDNGLPGLGAEMPADVADGTMDQAAPYPEFEAARSLTADQHQLAVPSVKLAAWEIAGGLQSTQREAMRSRQEQAFTVDVDRRQVKAGSANELLMLDSALNIGLYTARSELIDSTSGRIRFFPDGSSTGGRIDLELYGTKAAIKVDWSTGVVTVEQ